MKFSKGFLVGFIVASLLVTPIPLLAKEITKSITVKENNVTLTVDKYKKSNQKVYVINNEVYVPMKSMASLLHKQVSYDNKKNTVTYSTKKSSKH